MIRTFTSVVWGDGTRRRKLFAGIALLGLATATIGGGTAAVVSQDGGPDQHCIFEALESGSTASRVSEEPICFDTIEEAIRSIGGDHREFDANQ